MAVNTTQDYFDALDYEVPEVVSNYKDMTEPFKDKMFMAWFTESSLPVGNVWQVYQGWKAAIRLKNY